MEVRHVVGGVALAVLLFGVILSFIGAVRHRSRAETREFYVAAGFGSLIGAFVALRYLRLISTPIPFLVCIVLVWGWYELRMRRRGLQHRGEDRLRADLDPVRDRRTHRST